MQPGQQHGGWGGRRGVDQQAKVCERLDLLQLISPTLNRAHAVNEHTFSLGGVHNQTIGIAEDGERVHNPLELGGGMSQVNGVIRKQQKSKLGRRKLKQAKTFRGERLRFLRG